MIIHWVDSGIGLPLAMSVVVVDAESLDLVILHQNDVFLVAQNPHLMYACKYLEEVPLGVHVHF
jgi:hypothetical protein